MGVNLKTMATVARRSREGCKTAPGCHGVQRVSRLSQKPGSRGLQDLGEDRVKWAAERGVKRVSRLGGTLSQ